MAHMGVRVASRSRDDTVPLYSLLMRPHANTVFSLGCCGLEHVQRTATNLAKHFEHKLRRNG